jgi:translation initiation factor IF-1
MKTLISKVRHSFIDRSQRVATLVLTSAIAVTPLLSSQQAAQADPPRQAPAYGYRRDNDSRYDRRYRDNDRNGRRDDRNQSTLIGVVTQDTNGNGFQMRTEGGQTVVVRLRNEMEPRRLSVGDRVRVNGSYQGRSLIFLANDLDIVRDRNSGSNRDRDNDWNRGRNGDWSRDRNGSWPGSGGWNRDTDRNGGWNRNGDWNRGDSVWNGNEDQFNSPVSFPATVVSANATRLIVRGENGRQYTVLGRNSFNENIDAGDRVRVIGRARNSTVLADRVELTSNRR